MKTCDLLDANRCSIYPCGCASHCVYIRTYCVQCTCTLGEATMTTLTIFSIVLKLSLPQCVGIHACTENSSCVPVYPLIRSSPTLLVCMLQMSSSFSSLTSWTATSEWWGWRQSCARSGQGRRAVKCWMHQKINCMTASLRSSTMTSPPCATMQLWESNLCTTCHEIDR